MELGIIFSGFYLASLVIIAVPIAIILLIALCIMEYYSDWCHIHIKQLDAIAIIILVLSSVIGSYFMTKHAMECRIRNEREKHALYEMEFPFGNLTITCWGQYTRIISGSKPHFVVAYQIHCNDGRTFETSAVQYKGKKYEECGLQE